MRLALQRVESKASGYQITALKLHFVAFAIQQNAPVEFVQQLFERRGGNVNRGVRCGPFSKNVRGAIAGDGVVPLRLAMQFVDAA